MPITIIENGLDLLLTNTKTNQSMYLRNPTWEDLIETLNDFTDVDQNEPSPAAGPIVGTYNYVRQLKEHELTFYPGRATPNGWIATHLGTEFKHRVVVREDGGGTITMVRDDLNLWTATDRPRPGAFFEELQAVSGPENPNVEWSSNDLDDEEIVVIVDINPDEENEIEVILFPDAWGQAMWIYVTGSSPW